MVIPADQLKRELARALAPCTQTPEFEASVLLDHLFSCSAQDLLLGRPLSLEEESCRQLETLVQKRLSGYPLQYLVGQWEFMGLPFETAPGVLIPRADTETLVEQALSLVSVDHDLQLLDLCCGTGCIGLSLLHFLPRARAVLCDYFSQPLALTRRNAEINGLKNRADVVCENVLVPRLTGRFELIVSNPPYLTDTDMCNLQIEVSYEPAEALAGGPDGLNFYRAILSYYPTLLVPGGFLLFECGAGQAEELVLLLEKAEFHDISVVRDLGGIERVVYGKK